MEEAFSMLINTLTSDVAREMGGVPLIIVMIEDVKLHLSRFLSSQLLDKAHYPCIVRSAHLHLRSNLQ